MLQFNYLLISMQIADTDIQIAISYVLYNRLQQSTIFLPL